MNDFSPQLTQQLGAAIAITAVLSVLTLILLYTGIPFFGPVNDLITAVGGILIAGLALQFHPLLSEEIDGLALVPLLIAWAGAALIAVNAVLVAFGQMDWMLGGMYTAVGYALIGVWLLALLLILRDLPPMDLGLARLGLIAGTAMLFGFLAGPLLAGRLEMTLKPLAWIAYAAAGAGFILFPIWCWRLAAKLKDALIV